MGRSRQSVLTSAGAIWKKAQATTASYAVAKPASGVGLDLHIESGGTLAVLNSTAWPVPVSGVDQLRIRNFSGQAQTIATGAGWTMVTADGNPVTGGSYSLPDDRAIEITLDPDGFAQVVPWGGEVSVATFNGHTGNVSNPHSVTATQVGLGNASNTSDANKPVSTAQQTALDLKANLASPTFTGTVAGITKTMVGLTNVDNTADTAKPVSTAQQTAIDLKANTTSLTDGSISAQFDELRFDRVRLISNTNLDTLAVSGFYDGTNLTNAPGTSTGWFYVEHLNHSNASDLTWKTQKAYGLGSPDSGYSAAGTMYVRTMVSGTWSAWTAVWTSYTPVITSESGGWTNYTATGRYRIVDKMLTVSFRVQFSGLSSTADALYVSLPSGLTMNSGVMTGGAGWDTDQVGFAILGDSGTVSGVPAIITTRTNLKVLVKYYNAAASSYLTSPGLSNTAPWTWTTSDTVDGQFVVPIV